MGFDYEEKKKTLVVCVVIALVVWKIKYQGSILTVLMVGAVAGMVDWVISKWFQDSEGNITFERVTTTGSTVERGISNWLEEGLDGKNKFAGRKSIAVAVGAVVAWSISKLLGGNFRGATLIALAVGLVAALGISNWLWSLEEKRRKKKRNEGAMTAALAIGAVAGLAGLAALGAWSITKALEPDSEPAESSRNKEKMMKAPGSGYYMPRDDFEGNPSSYFRNLRAKNY